VIAATGFFTIEVLTLSGLVHEDHTARFARL
jgi:hypothetical protein